MKRILACMTAFVVACCSSAYSQQDCNGNDIPDTCEIDCNAPGCAIPGCGTNPDCNSNGVPDACDLYTQTPITSSPPYECAEFGHRVSLSADGQTALIGAFEGSFGIGCNGTGSAYVFEKFSGVWIRTAKLTASAGGGRDYFGFVSLSADGETALIGAPGVESSGYDNVGAAYVFVKPEEGWHDMTETARLTSSGAAATNGFFGVGVSLSADGTTALIGAALADVQVPDAGAAYVFVKPVDGWVSMTETAELTCSDSNLPIRFGWSVSLSADGQTALIGAPECPTLGGESGFAYVFVRPGSAWSDMTSETTRLKPSAAVGCDYFGYGIFLSGDGQTALIGAYENYDNYGTGPGSAYVYEKPAGGWPDNTTMNEAASLTASEGVTGDAFGLSVSLSTDGQRALVGAPYDDAPETNSGSAYLFEKVGGIWTQLDKLTAFDGAAGDWFGSSVCLFADGQSGLIGAHHHDAGEGYSGAAYLFGPNDCNANGVPDECEPDCNANGAVDACDIADGESQDADSNGVPDECERMLASIASCAYHCSPPDCPGNYLCLDLPQEDAGATPPIDPRIYDPQDGVHRFELGLSGPVAGAVTVAAVCTDGSSPTPDSVVETSPGTVAVEFSPPLPNGECCTLTLSGSATGTAQVMILYGDVSRNGAVNAADKNLVRAEVGTFAAGSPVFWFDVDRNNAINSADVNLVRAEIGSELDPSCP